MKEGGHSGVEYLVFALREVMFLLGFDFEKIRNAQTPARKIRSGGGFVESLMT